MTNAVGEACAGKHPDKHDDFQNCFKNNQGLLYTAATAEPLCALDFIKAYTENGKLRKGANVASDIKEALSVVWSGKPWKTCDHTDAKCAAQQQEDGVLECGVGVCSVIPDKPMVKNPDGTMNFMAYDVTKIGAAGLRM